MVLLGTNHKPSLSTVHKVDWDNRNCTLKPLELVFSFAVLVTDPSSHTLRESYSPSPCNPFLRWLLRWWQLYWPFIYCSTAAQRIKTVFMGKLTKARQLTGCLVSPYPEKVFLFYRLVDWLLRRSVPFPRFHGQYLEIQLHLSGVEAWTLPRPGVKLTIEHLLQFRSVHNGTNLKFFPQGNERC